MTLSTQSMASQARVSARATHAQGGEGLVARLAGAMAPLRAFVHARMNNKADADDIVQESLTRTLRRAQEIEIARLDFYAIGIARNLIADNGRQPQTAPIEPLADILACEAVLPDQSLSDAQRLAIFQRTLEAMPPLRREVFVRRRIEQQSREEIARALDLQVEAVKKHVSRAMAQLAQALDAAEALP